MGYFVDPSLMRRLREAVVPELRTWSWPIVWVASCGTGELAYAVAVVLHEEGVLQRAMLYATAPTEAELEVARAGVYAGCDFPRLEVSYRAAGGRASLSEYCRPEGDRVVVRPALRERMAFFQHDPLVDGSPNEFQLIVSGVPTDALRADDAARVLALYHASLSRFGSLALVHSATLAQHPRRSSYTTVAEGGHVHRRVR